MSGPFRYLLFDLDETLYPSSCGLMQEVARRMNAFVARYLGVEAKEAAGIRRELSRKYGTTLTGLVSEHALTDPEPYLAYTHDVDVERLVPKDPELAAALGSIELPKSVLTNSPMEHALRILDHLEIRTFFERIFDIRFNCLAGKPEAAVYTRVLDSLRLRAPEVLLIDNRLDYLLPFRQMGGYVLLVDESGRQLAGLDPACAVPWLRDIKELPAYLQISSPRTRS